MEKIQAVVKTGASPTNQLPGYNPKLTVI
uniref:Uncharacterized protein n=1 Tax=Anguilla anguilla TaxID=7936 RepID=A0A0E9Y0A0_ANGAN